MLRPVTPLLVDYLSVVAEGPPEAHGFMRDERGMYRDEEGWRAVSRTHARSGRTFTYADLSGEACSLRLRPMNRWTSEVKLTRIDATRDVIELHVQPALVYMFAGTRKARDGENPSHGWRESRTGATLYIGSPVSPLMLRLYTKNDAGPKLQGLWMANGWNGEQVTRIEYQCRTRQIARAVKWKGDEQTWEKEIAALWNDCLARVRLCIEVPMLKRQANEAKTAPQWEALAVDGKMRKLEAPPRPLPPPSAEHMARVLSSYIERGGDPRDIERVLASAVRVHKR